MQKAHLLTSTAAGVVLGALVFGGSPALSQMAVIDWSNLGIQQAIQGIQNAMSSTLTTITGQLGATRATGDTSPTGLHPKRQLLKSPSRRRHSDRGRPRSGDGESRPRPT
jgi:hypothetical protein